MNTTERIHALLEDRSFPSMVLLDGHWGVGKTYYVKNELQPYLKNYYPSPYKTIYLSLYGVTSLEDFKDRVLSLTYTENKKSSWLTKQGSDLIGSSAQAISGTRGVAAALGGVASIVKYHYFNKIDNLVLLLDDLERITCEKVRTQVIGECLNLAENKQHIKIVVIGNQDKIGTHADIEKAFSDIVHIKRTPAESLDVIKKIYTGNRELSEHELATISNCLKSLKLDNLRIILRATERYKSTCGLFKRLTNVDYHFVESQLIEASFRITTAIRRDGFTLEEINNALDYSYQLELELVESKTKEEDLSEDNKRKIQLEEYVDSIRYQTSSNLVNYIATYEENFYSIEQELRLPTQTEAINIFLSYGFMNKEDSWLKENIKLLKEQVCNPTPCHLILWVRCCDIYAFILDSGYIESNTDILFYTDFEQGLKEHDFTDDITSRDIREDIHTYLRNKRLLAIFEQHVQSSKEDLINQETKSFHDLFNHSYLSASSKVNEAFWRTAFLQRFTKDDLKKILADWSAGDIYEFSKDMNSRYSFSNIESYFSEEMDSLKHLQDISKRMYSESSYGVKKGNLKFLYETMQELHEKLQNRLIIPDTNQVIESVANHKL